MIQPKPQVFDVESKIKQLEDKLHLERTARQKAEDALQQDGDLSIRFPFAVQSSNDGIWEWNVKTNSMWFSQRCRTMFDYNEKEMPDTWESFKKILDPEDYNNFAKSILEYKDGKTENYRYVFRFKSKKNNTHYIMCRAILDKKNGEVVRVLGSHTDITELKESEEKLQNNNKLLHAISHVQSSFIVNGGDENTFKQAVQKIMEMTESKIGFIGEVIRDEDNKTHLMIRSYVETETSKIQHVFVINPKSKELECIRCDGTLAQTIATGKPVIRDRPPFGDVADFENFVAIPIFVGNEIAGLLSIGDRAKPYTQSDLLYIEPIIRMISNIMHAYKLEKQRHLSEEKIKLMVQNLTHTNAELERFAYVCTHDLKEPLRSISSFAQLISKRTQGKLNEEIQEYLDYLLRGVDHMQNLIHDILIYSKSRNSALNMQELNTSHIIKEIEETLASTIEESQAQIHFVNLPTIIGDVTQIRQLFQNLLSNAIKFRKKDRPEIFIKADRKKDKWKFSIKDNGIGIAPEYQEKIFEVFQRLHDKSQYHGNGIGLALCHRIVENHGGKIWLESKLGKGSTFFFTLPATDTEK